MTVNQTYLNYYFGTIWHKNSSPFEKFEKSGKQLLSKIDVNETVVDIGCGVNPFKQYLPNLIGIDPAFDQADFKCTIEDFNTDSKFDVALCLGSINFGDVNTIEKQISKVTSLLKPKARIFWRCNPGQQDHPNEECKEIIFYPWTIAEHVRLSEKFNFKLVECSWENNNKRIYAEWQKNN
jgi:hypothetical protein